VRPAQDMAEVKLQGWVDRAADADRPREEAEGGALPWLRRFPPANEGV
jgi:hypothetical protein